MLYTTRKWAFYDCKIQLQWVKKSKNVTQAKKNCRWLTPSDSFLVIWLGSHILQSFGFGIWQTIFRCILPTWRICWPPLEASLFHELPGQNKKSYVEYDSPQSYFVDVEYDYGESYFEWLEIWLVSHILSSMEYDCRESYFK